MLQLQTGDQKIRPKRHVTIIIIFAKERNKKTNTNAGGVQFQTSSSLFGRDGKMKCCKKNINILKFKTKAELLKRPVKHLLTGVFCSRKRRKCTITTGLNPNRCSLSSNFDFFENNKYLLFTKPARQ